MSALPPKADILRARRDVRFVPKADIGWVYGIAISANPQAMLVRAMPVVFPSALTLKPFSVEAEQKTPLR